MERRFYNIENEFLAKSIWYMGIKYKEFIGRSGNVVYGFIDNEEFREVYTKITELRNSFK